MSKKISIEPAKRVKNLPPYLFATIDKMKENIRIFQDLGIEIMGFFVIGWDEDTPDTYEQTLEFCIQMKIIPIILTLTPMPGSPIYAEYLEQGRLFSELSWDHYGGSAVVFKHPTMDPQEMHALNFEVLRKGFKTGRILSRAFHTVRHRPSVAVAMNSFFTQLALMKGFLFLYEGTS